MTDQPYHAGHGPWSDQIYRQKMGDLRQALFVESWFGVTGIMVFKGVEIPVGMFRLEGMTGDLRDQDGRTILVPHDIARDLGRRLIRVERDWQSGERRAVPPLDPSPTERETP